MPRYREFRVADCSITKPDPKSHVLRGQKLKEREAASHRALCGKSVVGGGSRCKGPEAKDCTGAFQVQQGGLEAEVAPAVGRS